MLEMATTEVKPHTGPRRLLTLPSHWRLMLLRHLEA